MIRSSSGRYRASAILLICALAWLSGACSASTTTASPQHLQLFAKDVPQGWMQLGQWQPPAPFLRQQLYQCLGEPVPTLEFQTASKTYRAPNGVVTLSVSEVFPSDGAAAHDLGLQRSTRYQNCDRNLVTQLFALLPAGLTFGSVSVGPLSVPVRQIGTQGYRFTLPVTGDLAGTGADATADTVTFVKGATETSVSFIGLAQPLPSTTESAVVGHLLAHT